MNKKIQVQKLVMPALKIFIFCMAMILSDSSFSQNKDDDYKLIKQVVDKICLGDNEIFISKKADNEYFVDIYKENINDSILFKSFKVGDTITRMDRNSLKQIFTRENFEYVESQTGKYTWEKDDLKKLSVNCNLSLGQNQNNLLTISKPIYTKNNYALVYYSYKNMLVLLIFKRKNGKWFEEEFIPLGMS